jgi:transitional endoplasmic reticulum ATPase
MEEPRSTGGSPAKGTTDKLPAEELAGNTTTQTTTNNGSQQNQAPGTVDSLQLVVVEGFQVGRGVARVDPADIAKLGCQPGDIVMITGGRTSAAKLAPGATADRGQQTIQMDSQVRQNSASGLGERVTVRKAKVRTAEKITLLPLSGGAPIQESDLQYIARYYR